MAIVGGGAGSGGGEVEAGFAKLQGEDFEYYMQTYSIVLGRNSKKATVDVDLASLGGGMNISRNHARIFYDFPRRRFALEIIGKNGCLVEGVLHLPGTAPVKLDSQDLLQIGDKKFYFLLPSRSIFATTPIPRHSMSMISAQSRVGTMGFIVKKGRARRAEYEEEEEDEGDEEDDEDGVGSAKRMKRAAQVDGFGGYGVQLDKKSDTRSRIDRESDNQQLLQLEEKDVVSSVATVLSDLCGPGEWMPMVKLHAELVEQYGNVWHHSRVRKYLTSEDWPPNETEGKPWLGLLTLLRKYPEHFVINTRSKGRVTLEFVSLVSLLS
ncbi:hypothetical protein J5N97_022049 [Dioscorea zingiberensis]|uniref:FHA domain-containing protein n=1 Tax=Dioscorea zingiberensis TaxID=325984 RepID=A0A9D5C9R8_9LILI|nr:hypothetical protein J5N97_022049 [Dioscorea zingiberensis]